MFSTVQDFGFIKVYFYLNNTDSKHVKQQNKQKQCKYDQLYGLHTESIWLKTLVSQ